MSELASLRASPTPCGIEAGAELVSLIGNVCTDSGVHDIQVAGTLDVFEDNVFETLRRGSVDPVVE